MKRRNPGTPARATSTTPIADADPSARRRQCSADTAAGLRRRRNASQRLVPLDCCCRDTWPCRHRGHDEIISDVMAGAAAAAIVHLDQLGTPGLLDERTCQAMWRIGHRRLAVAVHRRTAGAA